MLVKDLFLCHDSIQHLHHTKVNLDFLDEVNYDHRSKYNLQKENWTATFDQKASTADNIRFLLHSSFIAYMYNLQDKFLGKQHLQR